MVPLLNLVSVPAKITSSQGHKRQCLSYVLIVSNMFAGAIVVASAAKLHTYFASLST